MGILLRTLAVIAFILFSVAYFLWIYTEMGIHFTASNLFSWAFGVFAYVFVVWCIKPIAEDLFE